MHRRLIRPLAIAAVLATLAAGCSTGSADVVASDEAATVNGEPISNAQFEEYAEAAETTLPEDAGDDDVEAIRRTTLARMIETEAIRQFAEDNGATLDDAAVSQIVEDGGEQLATAAESTGLSPEQYARVFAAPDHLLSEVTRAVADGIEVTDAQVQERLAGGVEGVTATLSHILVEQEAAAQAALERIQGGEAFADVAAEVSIDGSSAQGGRLDQGAPVPLAGFVPEFAQAAATAPLGEPVGPVQSEFGFHLILVDERIEPDPEQQTEDLRTQIALESDEGQAAMEPLVAEFQTLFDDADVKVSTRYGEWDAATREIVDVGSVGEADPSAPAGGSEVPAPPAPASESGSQAPAPVPSGAPS